MQFVFFVLFALSLLAMYVAIRRQIASPGLIAGLGVLASIVFMTLFMLARDTAVAHGIVMGILVGILFAGATLAVAWYFQSGELREQYTAQMPEEHEEYYDTTPSDVAG